MINLLVEEKSQQERSGLGLWLSSGCHEAMSIAFIALKQTPPIRRIATLLRETSFL
jgi:hypothetical protein